MKLINTDGMAFIGPGSEWFWTAATGLILAGTFIAIYRQLHMQRSAGAIEQLGTIARERGEERASRDYLAIGLALREGTAPADLPVSAATGVSNYWERVGYLIRAGHLDGRLVYESEGGLDCRRDWALLTPFVAAMRTKVGTSKLYEHFEWLAGYMAARDREANVTVDFDDLFSAKRIDEEIQAAQGYIRTFEELRAVIVRPMSTASLTSELATPPA